MLKTSVCDASTRPLGTEEMLNPAVRLGNQISINILVKISVKMCVTASIHAHGIPEYRFWSTKVSFHFNS